MGTCCCCVCSHDRLHQQVAAVWGTLRQAQSWHQLTWMASLATRRPTLESSADSGSSISTTSACRGAQTHIAPRLPSSFKGTADSSGLVTSAGESRCATSRDLPRVSRARQEGRMPPGSRLGPHLGVQGARNADSLFLPTADVDAPVTCQGAAGTTASTVAHHRRREGRPVRLPCRHQHPPALPPRRAALRCSERRELEGSLAHSPSSVRSPPGS